MATDRQIRGVDDLGAWLIKGNADHVDLDGRFARDPRVTGWCLQPSYRLELMRAGQPVLFWASGSRRRDVAYGIWGRGRLIGPPERDGSGGWQMRLDLVIADRADRVPRELLREDPRLAGLEVLRQPQGANPSFVDVRQFAAIEEHLTGAVPRPGGRDRPARRRPSSP